jgi:hypothetical protein
MNGRVLRTLVTLCVMAAGSLAAALLATGALHSASPDSPVSTASYPNCRFGVGGSVSGFDVAALNVGWHLSFGTQSSPPHPAGAEYVQVIRLGQIPGGFTFSPVTDTLYSIMDQNPGAMWLIGNEPDSPYQDDLTPEVYARAYHHLFYLIKQHDPSAQVGMAGIVQPTPLRFQYLDRVWSAYQQYYSERLPTDLWNTHSYILREIDPTDPEAYPNGPYSVWGAFIPPGMAATRGILYSMVDMFSLDIFRQRLLDLRQWLANHGERNKPLYITEYGELWPYPPYTPESAFYFDENGDPITEERVARFMTGTFDILMTLTDPNLGYPADANRLVQRWLWYSVADAWFGGPLFDPATQQRRPLGDAFYTFTHSISPSVDLLALSVTADTALVDVITQVQTVTLKAALSNSGNISVTPPVTVAFYAGFPPTGTLIAAATVGGLGLNGCGATTSVSVQWPDRAVGAHPMYMQIDPDGSIAEASRANNIVMGSVRVLFAPYDVYLQLVFR